MIPSYDLKISLISIFDGQFKRISKFNYHTVLSYDFVKLTIFYFCGNNQYNITIIYKHLKLETLSYAAFWPNLPERGKKFESSYWVFI
jgi:hypothetical protein